MDEKALPNWEERLQAAGRGFPYPTTPDVAKAVRRRLSLPRRSRPAPYTFGWAVAAVLLLLAALLAVPPVRAQILEFIQIGVVRIFLNQPAPETEQSIPDPSLVSVLDLPGETSFAEAQAEFDFTIMAPAYPPDLGRPDKVFLQDQDGDVLVLVWLEGEQADQVRLSLHQFGPGVMAHKKWQPRSVIYTEVNGQEAVWAEGPYLLMLEGGHYELRRLITGRVLIWTEGPVTYRLETELPLDEAVKIAESLQPLE